MLLLTQLSAAAVLLNPFGLEIYYAVLKVGSHPNIATMFEWEPLTLRMKQGQVAAGMVCLSMFAVQHLNHRIPGRPPEDDVIYSCREHE